MSRGRWGILLLGGVGLLVWLASGQVTRPEGSSLSRDAGGWYGFRIALEQRGLEPELGKAPWDDLLGPSSTVEPSRTVLVTVLPWQRSMNREEQQALNQFLRRGGALVVAYSSTDVSEQRFLESLGMIASRQVREAAPTAPTDWWRWSRERFELEPEVGAFLEPLVTSAFTAAPGAPSRAEVYYRGGRALPQADDPEDEKDGVPVPLVFRYERLGGQVVVVPSSLLSNGEILEPGRLELLDRLAADLGNRPDWRFDEYHHGLLSPDLAEQTSANQSWDLFVLHLLILYVLAVWAEGRRFGPVWRQPPSRVGSTAEFLESLGGLHHRLGHHQDAARRMATRVQELYPRGDSADPPSPESVDDGLSFVDFARRLSRPSRSSKDS